ncbi:hypothetical protein BDP27DRAFT_1428147 [Rhodocollybia butyracea]|uniref:Uncharacterized protein n=1 Tax=Rhodocollybia butyracea TaxID=206335 RepID=A0A9P5PD67_9AGAR|nr:hypothetical protein BDP27DRAFT_1430690 [Rhodocollybia butyracea]KAF9061761.1 hypothetical protein BDP27DRAFT_1428612 [Rhodocollybia butyracea]KAF9062241.1 hypothetical protein BDP27DRAFT_1428147 [Rhodocollybia butyracea]
MVQNCLQPGTLEETRLYGLLNETLFFHKCYIEADLVVFPQLRILWKFQSRPEKDTKDRRSNVPDFGFGELPRAGGMKLRGGAELKAALTLMRTLPDSEEIREEPDFVVKVNETALQASDQVKAGIKSGFLPNHKPIKWIVMVGPYFLIPSFGPYNQRELSARAHRPNESGEASISEYLAELKKTTSSRGIEGAIYILGTKPGVVALHKYLVESVSLRF